MRSPEALIGLDVVSPALTMYRLCSFLLSRVLEPGSRSCQVGGVRKTGHKTAQADATNIDKGLTLSLREKESGYDHVYLYDPHRGSSPFVRRNGIDVLPPLIRCWCPDRPWRAARVAPPSAYRSLRRSGS
ncbi:hypothetical protein AGR7A_Lc90003 [Agrobacterium deltaense NCPPB 1641]|uniref:Uncharacterized protein n=1 Tax=Agrobacterium deltaense NCPPB 1641 TaxID=1183425 RepID=A0A1S7U6S7_9HYPH|nr:hypothetical protein AGR7A_Lc90003 [Agrobacterium deltaense NCPPB 1641]